MGRLNFLKTTSRKSQKFSKSFFYFIRVLFFFKFFWRKFIKLTLYILFFKFKVFKSLNKKKNILITVKKKKKSYILSSYFNTKLFLSTSIGCILKYFRIKQKFIKHQKKGFLLFMNAFKKIFFKFKYKYFNKSIFINFFNFYLIFFWKKFKFLINKQKQIKLFFNFNTHSSLIHIKKAKGIKRRATKKNFKNFLTDWGLINFERSQDLKFKVK